MQAVTNVRHAQTTSSKLAWSVVLFRWQRVLLVFFGLYHWTCRRGSVGFGGSCWVGDWRLTCYLGGQGFGKSFDKGGLFVVSGLDYRV